MELLYWQSFAVRVLVVSTVLICFLFSPAALGLETSIKSPNWGSVVNFVKKPTVTNVSVETHKGKTRIALDISRPSNLRYDLSTDGTAVFIQLPGINWSASPFEPRHSIGKVLEFRFSPGPNGGQFNILTDGPVSINEPYLTRPDGKYGHRIIIDLVPARYVEERLVGHNKNYSQHN